MILKSAVLKVNGTYTHTDQPNIQTSLAEVNLRKLMLSGAIHLMGSLPFEAA